MGYCFKIQSNSYFCFAEVSTNPFLYFSITFYRFTMSVRDVLSWVNFINTCTEDHDSESQDVKKLDLPSAYIHGACLTFLDSLGSGVTSIDR
jgi:AAA ATPase containing von Willebrand factor type A (vWA) domain